MSKTCCSKLEGVPMRRLIISLVLLSSLSGSAKEDSAARGRSRPSRRGSGSSPGGSARRAATRLASAGREVEYSGAA